jgi:hypothetical protein
MRAKRERGNERNGWISTSAVCTITACTRYLNASGPTGAIDAMAGTDVLIESNEPGSTNEIVSQTHIHVASHWQVA